MRFFVIIVLQCFAHTTGYAQPPRFKSQNDSVLYTRADSAFALSFNNSDAAVKLARSVLQESVETKAESALANAWNALGWALMHKGDLDSSVLCLQQSWQLFSKTGYDNDIIKTCINIAEVYTKQDKISSAIQYLLQADSLCIKTGNTSYHTNVYRQLGIIYRESGDYKQASFYLDKAFTGFLATQDYFRHVNTGISLSILYRSMKLPDSSLAVLNRCVAILKQHPGTSYQEAMVQEHLAETYYNMQTYPKALHHYTNAYNIFKQLNNKADLAFESMSVGKTLARLRRHQEAEKYLLEAYRLADTVNMFNYQYDAASELAELYHQTGDLQNAYHYLQQTGILKDSIGKAEQVKVASELKEKFESEKKEQEIALLKSRNALTEARNRRNTLLQYIFITLFVVAVIIGWLLVNRMRMKRKLDKQLLRNQIAGDLHDDIGSALSAIDIGSRIVLAKNTDNSVIRDHVLKIRQQAQQTLDSMSDIVWSVNPSNDSFESLLVRLKEFAAEICEPAGILLEFSVAPGAANLVLNALQRKNIFLIGKEAVNNAVKYSNCSTLSLSFITPGKKTFQMVIQDDGRGFDEAVAKTGNGLKNMKARAAAIQAQLTINSSTGMGTRIAFNCLV